MIDKNFSISNGKISLLLLEGQFGRNIYISEIYQLLDRLPEVDYVERQGQNDEVVILSEDSERKERVNGQLSSVKLYANELVNAQIEQSDIDISPAGSSVSGG